MNHQVLRIIDVNANRAREALRVIEDYTRFWLDDQTLCAQLKQLRHDLASSLEELTFDAILHRDTPQDVGRENKTAQELNRSDVTGVVTAAGKRFGEAIRTLEEFSKIDHPDVAVRLEAVRYGFYDMEMRIARTLRPMGSFARVRLYVLITESMCHKPWLSVARQVIRGGADCLQLREKSLHDTDLCQRANRLVELCHRNGVICIINDRPDIALLAKADGVHVGQDDLPVRQVRKLVGRDLIIGVSTHSIDQAKQAVLDGADYIGVGPVFRSSTKPRDVLPGLDYARHVAAEIRIPAVAIAGIDAANVDDVIATGIRAVAVSSAVIGADDPEQAARQIKCKLQASGTGCPTT